MTVSFKKYLSAYLEETNKEFPKEKAKDIEGDVPFEKVSLVINYSTIQLRKETKFDGCISDFFKTVVKQIVHIALSSLKPHITSIFILLKNCALFE